MPAAWEITVAETLALLETEFDGFVEGVAQGRYALWLGSGISLDRIVGVRGVIARVIEYLRSRRDPDDPDCRFNRALERVLADLTQPERACVHLEASIEAWPEQDRLTVTSRLARTYSQVLQTPLDGEAEEDFLLWTAVDVPGSFINEEPDVEHLCVVLLALEGAFADISSANWDYLIEAAERELTGAVGSTIDVCILPEHFQAATGPTRLLKYHGCAARAVENPGVYRPLLIARRNQIVQYRHNASYNVMRNRLLGLVQQRRTLMIGFSAQDPDVQEIFTDGAQHSNWSWNVPPTPFIFAEEALSDGQKTVLAMAYGAEYHPNHVQIEQAARLRAFGKPLLIALVLAVLQLKLASLVALAAAGRWNDAEQARFIAGLRFLRDKSADIAETDRLAFTRLLIGTTTHFLRLYHDGESTPGAAYYPLSTSPVQQLHTIPAPTGLRQLATAIAFLGTGASESSWTITTGVAEPIVVNQGGTVTRVFFAANDEVAIKMLKNGHVDQDDNDAVLVLSASAAARRQRSPSRPVGRTGKVGLREVCMADLIEDTPTGTQAFDQFKRSASI